LSNWTSVRNRGEDENDGLQKEK
jgi:hypothetical protein